MYEPHLRVNDHGVTWTMVNPLRHNAVDPGASMPGLLDRADQAPRAAATAGVGTGVIIAGLLLLISPVTAAVLSGIGGGVVVGYMVYRAVMRSVDDAADTLAALDATLGPLVWDSATLLTPAVAAEARHAKDAALTVSRSSVFQRGNLGDPHIVGADLSDALWEVTQHASDIEARNRLHGNAITRMFARNATDHVDDDVLSVADASLAADLADLRSNVTRLQRLADEVGELDAVLFAPGIEEQLRAVCAPLPRQVDTSAIDRLSAQIDAATTILEHGGSRPDPWSEDGPNPPAQ